MADAVSEYARYRLGPHAWMLGRFIVPRRRLDELEQHLRSLSSDADAGAGEPWRVSALASDDLAADRVAIDAFNARPRDATGTRACIDTVEVKVESTEDVRRIADGLPSTLTLWFEVTPGRGPVHAPTFAAVLDAIGTIGERAGAKLRTGGMTPDAIPAAAGVAQFLLACARARVACKATAGLHHPIHAPHRLTYADDSPTALMHGFVNVFLAATLARDLVSRPHPQPGAGADDEIVRTLVALLDERDAHHFAWHDDRIAWRGYQFDIEAIASTRARFARSFGSCSFEEPIEDLTQLGWL
jgi:hypothetical protein